MTDTERRVSKTIDEWYSSAWHRGVRLGAVERERLARFLAQREDARTSAMARAMESRVVSDV